MRVAMPAPGPMVSATPKYDYIDALRGLAVLGVLMVHSAQAVAPVHDVLNQFMFSGARGVQLFYIASALTLCMSWRHRSTLESAPLRNFFLRRFFRIAPMFYLAIVFYACLYGLEPRYFAPSGVAWWYLPLTGAFLNGFHPETITSVVPGGWSIAVEMNFYLLLPFVLRRVAGVRSSAAFLALTVAAYVATKAAFAWMLDGAYPEEHLYLVSNFLFLNIFAQLPVFALGISAWFVLSGAGAHAGGQTRALKRAVVAGNLLLAGWLLLSQIAGLPSLDRASGHFFAISAGFAVFTATLAAYPVKLLVNQVTRYLGRISFSMYLSHFAVIELFEEAGFTALFRQGDTHSILHWLCVVAATALVSQPLYALVERRGVRAGQRLIDRLEAAVPARA